MRRKQLTDKKVEHLKPKDSRYEVWDGDGFGVRVGSSGKKSWVFMGRDVDGRVRRYTLGRVTALNLAEARDKAEKFRKALARGDDPGLIEQQERQRRVEAPTVKALCKEYIEKHAKPNKRSWREDERYLERFVIPAWGAIKAEDITRRQVIDLIDGVAPGAPTSANRLLAVVRKMFNFAIEKAILEATPCAQVKAPAPERQRDRILSEPEVRELWHAMVNARSRGESFDPDRHPPMSETTSLALRVQLLTAQRIGEVVGAPWSEFNLDSGWWTIAADRSKNRLPHRVPLTQPVLELLERARELGDGSAYVFPGKRFTKPERQRDEPIKYTVADYALRRTRERYGLERFTPHDLRRTAASYMTGAGVSRLVVAKILNHAERGITAVYDRHSYDQEKREALEVWSRELSRIVNREGVSS